MTNSLLAASTSVSASPLAASIVGVIGAAIITAVGWFGRRFAARMDSQDRKLDQIGSSQQTLVETIPVHHRRITDLERGHRRTRKILDRLTWIIEEREQASVSSAAQITTTGPARITAATTTRKAPK